MKRSKICISFSEYTDGNLETKAEQILKNMTDNTAFTDPIPTLEQLRTAIESYSAALIKATNLGRIEVAEKNKCRQQLELVLNQLGMYVMFIANGDAAILTSSGYTLAKTPEPQNLSNPGIVIISNGITSGELIVKVKSVKGAKSYLHQITMDPLTSESQWQSIASSKSTYTFKNLEAGKKYWVRIAAIGRDEQIAYSPNGSQFVQ